MIKFRKFITTIQNAVLSANDALMRKNLKLLDQYFDDAEEIKELREALQNVAKTVDTITEQSRARKVDMENIKKAVDKAKQVIGGDINEIDSTDFFEKTQALRPKVTKIQYPEQTQNGMEIREVSVPLITMVPLSMSQISSFRFKTKLEVYEIQGELNISFPMTSSEKEDEEKARGHDPYCGEIEIIIEPNKESNGLKKIVEGYEKVLRAQIPH